MGLKNISRLIQEEINANRIAGARCAVAHNGEIIFNESYGFMNIENKESMRKDTIFRLYSLSKPIAAVACMILYERGLIDLHEPVSKYIGSFKEQRVWTKDGEVPADSEITIKELLSMTSGLVYPDCDEAGKIMEELYQKEEKKIQEGNGSTTQELCNLIGKQPLAFQPGTKWRYGTSTDILGAVMEKIYGTSLGEFYKKEIFEPLGMKDTGFFVPLEKQERFSELYMQNIKDGKCQLEVDEKRHLCLTKCLEKPAFESAGAGLVSTLDDYMKFAMMLANNGELNGVRILGRKTIDLMTTNQLLESQMCDMNWESMLGYGYGFFMRVLMDQVKAASNASIGEFGWDGWTGPYLSIDREENTVFLYMIQVSGYSDPQLIRKMKAIVNANI